MIAPEEHGSGAAQAPLLAFWFEWRKPQVWPSSWTIAERKLPEESVAEETPSLTTTSATSMAVYDSPLKLLVLHTLQPKKAVAMTPGQQLPLTSLCGSSAMMRDSLSERDRK